MKFILCVLAVSLLAGCSAYKQLAPISNTFLQDVDVTKKLEKMPFQHSWVWAEDTYRGKFKSIYIPAIVIDTLPPDASLPSLSPAILTDADYRAKAREVADYFREQIIDKIKNYPENRFQIVNQRGPQTAVIEMAITELEFSHPGAYAATFASPVPGTGVALSAVTQPHAAFALRITDGETGRLIATAADRKFPPMRIADLNQLTISSSTREICSFWAEEIAAAIEKGRFGEVESVGRIRILPW
jgi:hypothetical protein